jgi:hypothetical protein
MQEEEEEEEEEEERIRYSIHASKRANWLDYKPSTGRPSHSSWGTAFVRSIANENYHPLGHVFHAVFAVFAGS